MITARNLVQEAFIAYPQLKKLPPEKVVEAISGSMETQMKDPYSGNELSAKVRIDYVNSNLRGHCYFIVCDICSAKCRKAYVKKVVIANVAQAKVLCGICARIKYKRKTPREKTALELAFNPEKLAWVVNNSHSTRNAILGFEAIMLRDELEEKARKLAKKASGELGAEVIE